MQQLSKTKSILYHIYPGIIIAACFVLIAPFVIAHSFPPQFGFLLAIIIAAIPVMVTHLFVAKKSEHTKKIWQLNGYTNKLPTAKLILYAVGLVVFSFLVWGVTQPCQLKQLEISMNSTMHVGHTIGLSLESLERLTIIVPDQSKQLAGARIPAAGAAGPRDRAPPRHCRSPP